MAPPLLPLVLHEKKEEDSTKKYDAEVQERAPPLPVEVIWMNKQFKT
jgi:hypothetical protein